MNHKIKEKAAKHHYPEVPEDNISSLYNAVEDESLSKLDDPYAFVERALGYANELYSLRGEHSQELIEGLKDQRYDDLTEEFSEVSEKALKVFWEHGATWKLLEDIGEV